MKSNTSTSEKVVEISRLLAQIEADSTIPKGTRTKLKETINNLKCCEEDSINVDRVRQWLDEIAEDPNLPAYVRTQVWNVISVIENLQ